MTFQAKQTRPQSRAIPPFPASAVGQRFQFEDGQRGEVVALVNGGALATFASDTGARFTVRSDELSPIGSPLPPPRPSTVGIFRTIARFESAPGAAASKTHKPAHVARPRVLQDPAKIGGFPANADDEIVDSGDVPQMATPAQLPQANAGEVVGFSVMPNGVHYLIGIGPKDWVNASAHAGAVGVKYRPVEPGDETEPAPERDLSGESYK